MPLIELATLDDPQLDVYRHLKDTNATRWAAQFVVEGDKLVERLLASDFEVLSVLLGRRWVDDFADRIPQHVTTLVVPDAWVPQIVGFNFHRGALACARRKPSANLDAICVRPSDSLTLAVCPDVQNPENLGSIIRLASAFGLDGVVLGESASDPFSRRVLRVSMGASLQIPIIASSDIQATLIRLRNSLQVETWATVIDPEAEPLETAERPRRLAIVLGSEGHGLEPRVVRACERRITIPMRPAVDSLNVAAAASIFLYHVTR